MSKYTDEEVNRILSDTGELDADVSGAEKFDLEDILAEFGPGSAAPKAPPETQAAESPEPKAEEASISPAERKRQRNRRRRSLRRKRWKRQKSRKSRGDRRSLCPRSGWYPSRT